MEPIKHDVEDEMLTALYITNRRIYDTLVRILANISEEDAELLMNIHREGFFITPEPSYRTPDE